MTIGYNKLYYKDYGFEVRDGIGTIIKNEYGPFHTFFYVLIFFFYSLCIFALVYSFFKKRKKVPRTVIILLFIPVVMAINAYVIGRFIISSVELTPLAYVFAQFMYLLIIHKIELYDVNDSGIDSLIEKGDTGFASFDFKYRYLGSNETARMFLPMLDKLVVDKAITELPELKDNAVKWLDSFRENENKNEFNYKIGEKTYQVNINYLYDGKKKRGYQFFITDDTLDQQYISLLNQYNDDLNLEVKKKTEDIIRMHDKLILSMATMIESRDNSTGGHIKRTSKGVRLLIEEMKKDDEFDLTDEFCEDVVKAAPMHDIGKIAVDDAILRKPGRFTPEEYEIMKTHSSEGARIVHEILSETNDESFKKVAENVAHYHHERIDGSGYPDKLKGDEIPLEARIMAIADVYDALVSKRVYKESMSFEQADKIILDGMGTQFDKRLEKYYINARPKLEKYYSEMK